MLGTAALFSTERLDRNMVPEGLNCYELQYGARRSVPLLLKDHVKERYFGTVITAVPFDFGNIGYATVDLGNYYETDVYLTVAEYEKKMDNYRSRGAKFRIRKADRTMLSAADPDMEFSVMELKNRQVLFTGSRIEFESVPDELCRYELGYGEDKGFPVLMCEFVREHFFGTVLSAAGFDMGENWIIGLKRDDCILTGERMSIRSFMEKMDRYHAEGVFEYNGFHYLPVRSMNQEEKNMSLREISRYLSTPGDTALRNAPYSHERFYAGFREKYGKETPADIFLCLETEKECIPCSNSLMEYTKGREVKKEKAR